VLFFSDEPNPNIRKKRGNTMSGAAKKKAEPRIPYITRDEWTEDTIKVFTSMERDEAGKARASREGSRMNIINVLALYPRAVLPYLDMNKVLFEVSIGMRLREIIVLRVAHLSQNEYEWFQHLEIGKRAGLTSSDIDAIQKGSPASDWSVQDGLVMDAVTEMEKTNNISDALWKKLADQFDREQLFDLLFVIGAYKMTAWIMNAIQLPPEDSIQH
jgi:alkylhydroperoxidase family enzyme